ncbi:ATP-dependent DNA helicase PIF1-like [Acyrthosiphon pisum]|uniref:ATP-dependent DNA helicase n=1 Tax=Acyrthosiphon pisum TaxID=7029 RepID=A0A8R2F7L0_ACYPI|nr:ATP-dependent DNA helicase PIF1-like [Acyrthosiphon pisum]|eukprot:XP_008182247.1 PREDICTED: ATP-dependent DNA helicase PIF1-like [Acyrthosiphon pisum]
MAELYCPLLTGNWLKIMRQQWKDTVFFIDEISMVPYEMLCMIDSRLKQLKNNEDFFGGINILVLGDLMQLPPVRASQVFQQPERMIPATRLWGLFSLVELTENMRQQGDQTFIDILNALRVGELMQSQIEILINKQSTDTDGEFALEKALRIYPTNDQVNNHNQKVLNYFKSKGVKMWKIKAQDKLVDSTRKLNNDNTIDSIIPKDNDKTGGLPKEIEIFVGAKVMLRTNLNVSQGLVNGAIGNITEINWPNFTRDQLYDECIPTSIRVEFGRDGINKIEPISIQFSAMRSYGTAERRMLPIILSWAVNRTQVTWLHRRSCCRLSWTKAL